MAHTRAMFRACRTGDVCELKRALQRGVNIEIQDTWGNTPLYLASLCGHLGILKVLLENGAAYNSSTTMGQRVKLSALTDPIRQELKKYDRRVDCRASAPSYADVTSPVSREPVGASAPSYAELSSPESPQPVGASTPSYAELSSPESPESFRDSAPSYAELTSPGRPNRYKQDGDGQLLLSLLTRLLNKGLGYDVVAKHGDEQFLLHRFIILARCPPLAEILMLTHENRIPAGYSTDITASFSSKESLQKILEYIYTGCTDYDHASAIDVETDAIKLNLLYLAGEMRKNIDTRNRSVNLSNQNVGGKKGWKEVVRDLSKVAMCGMDEEYHYVVKKEMVSRVDSDFKENCSHDLVINIKNVRFCGQKAMFLCNEEAVYFHSLILPHLEEEEGRYEAINLSLPPSAILPETFARIFTYFYNGNFNIHPNLVIGDIIDLCIGTEYLRLPRLQSRCVKLLEKMLSEHNVLVFLKIAQQKKSAEIISTCENYIFTHEIKMFTDDDFCQQIMTDVYQFRNEVKVSPLLALLQGANLSCKHNMTRLFNSMLESKDVYDIQLKVDDDNLFSVVDVSPEEQTAKAKKKKKKERCVMS